MRRISFFGDSAILVDAPSVQIGELALALTNLDGVEEVVPGAVICVRFAPGRARAMEPIVADLVADFGNGEENGPVRIRHGAFGTDRRPGLVELPVSFDGADLDEVAQRSGMSPEEVIESILAADLTVAYLGFSPGFAYVTGLPDVLAGLERRPTPRTWVPAGSVGIAGGYLGIYPQSSPGGWNLVGHTDARLFDPARPPYSTLQAGDTLKIIDVGELAPTHAVATFTDRPRSGSPRRVEVVRPGALTMLEDRGRIGVAHLGIPKAGPADPDSMRLANLTVGNLGDRGVLETTMSGPTLLFHDSAHVVVIGASWELNGRAMEPGAVCEIPAGGVVAIGAAFELHGYLAVAGGLEGPSLFGSCASDLLSGLGPGPLVVGDELGIGRPGRPYGYAAPLARSNAAVRVLPGPMLVDGELLAQLTSLPFKVSPDSNRIGTRLVCSSPLSSSTALGETRHKSSVGETRHQSYGMVPGAVQVPPSGEPVVLLCDHATMGGYPVVATVISADIGVIAQRRPGETVHFEMVDLDQAIEALEALERQVAHAPTGIYPSGPVT